MTAPYSGWNGKTLLITMKNKYFKIQLTDLADLCNVLEISSKDISPPNGETVSSISSSSSVGKFSGLSIFLVESIWSTSLSSREFDAKFPLLSSEQRREILSTHRSRAYPDWLKRFSFNLEILNFLVLIGRR